MSAVSVQRVRDSPFRESEWDRRLDDMLEDLGTGGSGGSQGSRTVTQTQQFSSSSTQQTSYSSQQGTRTQSASQQSQAVHRSVSGPGQQPQQQHFQQQQQQRSQQGNFALTRGPSGADLAEGTLRDLEDGLEKSTRYIQDSHREGGSGFNLEQQVQHMIPQSMQQRQQTSSSSSVQQQKTQQQTSYSQNVQQQQQQQYNQVYKVQSNQYSGSGERITGQQQQAVEEEDRPGSRLKQNIDELDTLLYDLNNARNLSPETAEYGTTGAPSSHGGGLLDSDDYDETVGTTGHVKRTVSAFNEYTTQQGGKPPSPSPRRKPSPAVVRKTPPTSPTRMHQNSATSSGYQQQQQTSYTTYTNTNNSYNNTSYNQTNNNFSQEERAASPYQPLQGPPGSYQPFSYTETTDSSRGGAPPRSPSPQPTAVPFPSSSARPPTPQMPPKRVEELMSEFQEFDSTHGGSVSPAPAPFSVRPAAQPRQHGHVTVTELEDEPPKLQPSPPRKPAASTPGPDVYYPPEFTNTSPPAVVATQEVHPVADGGSLALERKGRRERERRREEGGDKQGAAVIPICLPLCCAAPCVIM